MPLDDPTRSLRPGTPAPVQTPGEPDVPDWTLVRKLGHGGFGDVYEAEHARTHQRAALKVLHAHFVTSAEMLARFDREVKVLDQLRHPNVAKILEAGFDARGRPYLCMELLVGRDVAGLLRERGRLAPSDVQRVLEPLSDALEAAHAHGIIHRDLKASNVFVCDGSGRVVLLDFGIAKLSDALAPELTASHQSLGTPGCMAPEQIHGGRVDSRTDVYALGALLFHTLTGRIAFHDPSETMMQYLHLHGRRPRASSIASVSERVDDLIMRAMAIEPAQRFDSVAALRSAARIALREPLIPASRADASHVALFAIVADRTGGTSLDEALLDDLESVLPELERCLAGAGFWLAADFGSSALYVTSGDDPERAVQAALAAWDQLEQREQRDDRVRIGLALHRAAATVVGTRVEPGPLLRPNTWGLAEPLEGLWLTTAFEQGGRRLR